MKFREFRKCPSALYIEQASGDVFSMDGYTNLSRTNFVHIAFSMDNRGTTVS